MDCTVLGVTKSQTQLSDFHFTSQGNIAGPLGEPQGQWFAVHFRDRKSSQKRLWPLEGVSARGSEHSHHYLSNSSALHAKSLQSCLTLCGPMNCSSPGSSVHGILQARILGWVAISFSRGILPIQGSNPNLLHCRQTLDHQCLYIGFPHFYVVFTSRSIFITLIVIYGRRCLTNHKP